MNREEIKSGVKSRNERYKSYIMSGLSNYEIAEKERVSYSNVGVIISRYKLRQKYQYTENMTAEECQQHAAHYAKQARILMGIEE